MDKKDFWALPMHSKQFLMTLDGPHETEKSVRYIEYSEYEKVIEELEAAKFEIRKLKECSDR